MLWTDWVPIIFWTLCSRDGDHIQPRELGVGFRDLRVLGVGASKSYQPTFGSVFNPLNIVETIHNARHPPVRTILTDVEGVIRPGQMLLMSFLHISIHLFKLHTCLVVLGRPGSGCTTLQKTIANLPSFGRRLGLS